MYEKFTTIVSVVHIYTNNSKTNIVKKYENKKKIKTKHRPITYIFLILTIFIWKNS